MNALAPSSSAPRADHVDAAFVRTVHEECAPRVHRYLAHVLRDTHAAEDVLQQVMLEAWQRAGSFDPQRGSLITWLMTIARSRAIDYLRRHVPEPHDPQSTTAMIERAAVEDAGPDEVAAQAQLAEMLSRLPAQEAQLLRMRFHLDMSQSAIAEQTGIPLGTVKMRMVSALRRLRTMIEAEGLAA